MNIIVIDDDFKFINKIEIVVKEYFCNKKELVKVEKYSNGEQVLRTLNHRGNEDVYLLDIEMPGMSGMELAQKILEWNEEARIVFLTSYETYAYSSIKIGIPYFIRKDEYKELIPIVLDRILKKKKQKYYVFETGSELGKIELDNVLYIKKEGKNTVFHCKEDKKYEQKVTLEKAYERLSRKQFIFIARGLIVNIGCVKGVDSKERCVELIDGTKLYASRRYMSNVKEELEKYLRRSV